MKIRFYVLCCTLILPIFLIAQIPKKPTSADIYQGLKKLNFLGSVLYVAAHPDDENTRLISYFSNKIHAETAYLAMTRGDGGQNLIGKEIRSSLGVIRTQELLAARRIDGAQQFFTRANDFGYSKNPTETFKIWGKQNILNDVVWVFRKFKPDVIINRFNVASAGKTHGHHTASAILSNEAFTLAGDKKAFPNQLKNVKIWHPNRMFFNTSWYFYGSKEKFSKADKTGLYKIDDGVFYPLKGKSNNELAAEARTMHKSQGFGSKEVRGSSVEYLKWLKGSMPSDKNDIFSGINTTWTRLKGGKPIGKLVTEIIYKFNFEYPEKSISKLIEVYKLIDKLPNGHWQNIKLNETANLIQYCAGLYFEALASDFYASPNDTINLNIEAINRSKTDIILRAISIKGQNTLQNPNQKLIFNKDFNFKEKYKIPAKAKVSNAYWLNKKSAIGLFEVSNKKYIGLPETPPALVIQFFVSVNGYSLLLQTPVVYKKIDPVRGEVYRRFEIAPPVFSQIENLVNIFPDNKSKNITVLVKAGRNNLSGILTLNLNKDWKVSPSKILFSLKNKNDEKQFTFKIIPPQNQSVTKVNSIVTLKSGKKYNNGYQEINYNHIPPQLITSPIYAKFIRLSIVRKGQNIAYIMGAGDVVPASLQQIGYSVMILKDADITSKNLKHFDAVILGVRAYNIDTNLRFKQKILYQYVANGGTMIVQYNTSFRLKVKQVAPYPIHLSHDRVTVENAKVSFLNPNSEILNYPNKIKQADFDGWVQERGLYFPDKWDAHFTPILGMHDPGETEKKGSLLVAKYKKGYFIYTGLSFFRELPAGVPGAFKLFANMISIGKNKDKQAIKN